MNRQSLMKHSSEELNVLINALEDQREPGQVSDYKWQKEANEHPDDLESVTSNCSLEVIYLNDIDWDSEDDSVVQSDAEKCPEELKVRGLARLRPRMPSLTLNLRRAKGSPRAAYAVSHAVMPTDSTLCGTDSDDTRKSSKGSSCSKSKRGWLRLPSPRTSPLGRWMLSTESGLSSPVAKRKEAWV